MNTTDHTSKQTGLASKSAGAGLFAAIVASLCCITPVFSLLAGIGGIAATFSWMEPLRPYLIVLTIGILAFAWYQKLKPRTAEEIACACEEDEKPSFWQSKKFLGMVTVFAGLMLAFPTYSHIFYPDNGKAGLAVYDNQSPIKLADFNIEGMTCTGCEEHVKHAVSGLDGVIEATASHKNANAQVRFNASVISLDNITKAINSTGYTVVASEVKDAESRSNAFQAIESETIQLAIKGMTCAGCEAHITHAVSELEGIEEVDASYEDGKATVKYHPDKVSKKEIVEAINETGYRVIEKSKKP